MPALCPFPGSTRRLVSVASTVVMVVSLQGAFSSALTPFHNRAFAQSTPVITPTAGPAPAASSTPEAGSTSVKEKAEPTTAEVLEQQNKKFQSLESFARVLGLLETSYVEESAVQSEALIERALKGMVASLDPHTTYLPASQLRDLTNDTSGKFGGIGVILQQQDTKLEVVEVLENSPAARGGIIGGDIIFAVDGLEVNQKNMDEVLNRMRGLPGSSVTLELVAPSDAAKWEAGKKPGRTRKVNVTREVIRTSSVTHARLSPGYAYVKVSVFQEDVSEQVDKALRLYEAENGGKLDGLILDLRGNPGGLLDQAVRLSDLFLDSGIIVSTIGRDRAKQEVEYATKRNTHPYMPLVVLVNEGSASASEIVAGALQDHNRALVVGSTSFGKGSVQSIVQLPNGAGLKMTIARYYTPKGRSIQAKGIVPDIPIPTAPAGSMASTGSNAAAKDSITPTLAPSRGERNPRKEADLEGHIDAADLDAVKGGAAARDGFSAELEKWPSGLRSDNQLRIAYTYLRSWARFSAPRTLPGR
ncbi:MAG: S41 family peptidase [Silvanigrellales bacterium]|nr:S41 family peptidase [Silvanigrellales bacterium]